MSTFVKTKINFMVTSYLRGGLGNLMFQVAAAHSLGKRNSDTAVFSKRGIFNHRPLEMYTGNVFKDVMFVDDDLSHFDVVYEKGFEYNEIAYRNNICLYGYFQSEKYFDKEDIIRLFTHKEHYEYLAYKYRNILKDSVSLHVRRGDYLGLSHVHPQQSMTYYHHALEIADRSNVLIFSDDIPWCKEYFKGHFIEGLEDFQDMYLMSLCSSHITANSSFSWWGAFLGGGMTIMPRHWFNNGIDTKDLYIKDCIII